MPTKEPPRHPASRRYTEAEKEQAVRLVRPLRKELGTDQGTVGRVARQLGYGEESVRAWVKQADIDQGVKPGVTSAETETGKGPRTGNKRAEAGQ
jgi:transposase